MGLFFGPFMSLDVNALLLPTFTSVGLRKISLRHRVKHSAYDPSELRHRSYPLVRKVNLWRRASWRARLLSANCLEIYPGEDSMPTGNTGMLRSPWCMRSSFGSQRTVLRVRVYMRSSIEEIRGNLLCFFMTTLNTCKRPCE